LDGAYDKVNKTVLGLSVVKTASLSFAAKFNYAAGTVFSCNHFYDRMFNSAEIGGQYIGG
jgi:hypothetical protein